MKNIWMRVHSRLSRHHIALSLLWSISALLLRQKTTFFKTKNDLF